MDWQIKWAVENGWGYWDKGCLSLEELYSIVENVLKRHPKLKVTFAHFYFVSDDPAHAERVLGWRAQRDLQAMCEDAWRWQSGNPRGYESA